MLNLQLNFYAFICTRSEELSSTTNELLSYLSSAGVETKLLIGKNSIFTAYEEAFNEVNPKDNDIIILCHDDIEILNSLEHFKRILTELAMTRSTGFIGPAGTACLTNDGVWWNQRLWKEGRHRGYVVHGNKVHPEYTFYGMPGRVVVLDGLFLAAKASTIRRIGGLSKPPYFPGAWDFYDLHYTLEAHLHGYANQVPPLFIRHESHGELAGRGSWHVNREAFVKHKFLDKNMPAYFI